MSRGELVDAFGRVARKLRISVTDRCNFRCRYCMPEAGVPWIPREEILTFEEIERIARIAVRLGIRRVRLTGGEPLIRREIESLVSRLARIPELEAVGLTTNGYFLKEKAQALKEAGLRGINISLDTLQPERFQQIARRPGLDRVWAGVEAAREAGLSPIKLNMVVIRGLNDDEIGSFVQLARDHSFTVRFIEVMPLDGQGWWRPDLVVSGQEILARVRQLAEVFPLVGDPSEPARRFRFADGRGEIGIIAPVSDPFCRSCDRIRLTADGQLLTCLFGTRACEFLPRLRGGASDEELAYLFSQAVSRKEAGHLINRPGFVRPSRPMSAIGG